MKKEILSKLFAVLFAFTFVAVTTSCDDEEDTGAAPTIELSESTAQNIPGSTVSVTATVSSPNGGKTLQFSGISNPDVALNGSTSQEVEVEIAIPANAVVGSSFVVVFTALDNKNLTSSPVELTVTVGDPIVQLQGNITANLTLDADTKYLLKGKVYVQAPATLTIPAGTIIVGDKVTQGTLIINRGAKINAQGTAANPIIFTSSGAKGFRNRGDWGGVVINGFAYTNGSASSTIEGISASGSENGLYGPGTNNANDADDSGTLRYVRIEFAGIPLSQDNELNSLTMGSVGSSTDIDHVMISYANDDAFEWFGGSVSHKYMIAYSTIDDDFDTDRGYNGNIQFGLVVRDPAIADFSGSRAFETSSNNTADVGALPAHGITARHSQPTFSNFTVLGPRLFRAAAGVNGFYQAAVEINTSSSTRVYNSILTGFTTGVRWNASGANAVISGNVFALNGANTATSGGSSVPGDFATANTETSDVTTIFGPYTAKNASSDPANNIYLLSGLGVSGLQVANSPALTGFVNPGAAFDQVTFRGAFGTSAATEWGFASGWINFDPIIADY
jgi:hypothetical protein